MNMAITESSILVDLPAMSAWVQGQAMKGLVRDRSECPQVAVIDVTYQGINARKRLPCQRAPFAGAMEWRDHGALVVPGCALVANSRSMGTNALLVTFLSNA